jgi:hypothetical protein
MKVDLIHPNEIAEEAALAKMYQYGYTKDGMPIVCIRASTHRLLGKQRVLYPQIVTRTLIPVLN